MHCIHIMPNVPRKMKYVPRIHENVLRIIQYNIVRQLRRSIGWHVINDNVYIYFSDDE